MGLGRLNPGCNTCGCVPVPPPANNCQLASQIIQPASMSLSCPSISLAGGRFIHFPWCLPAPFLSEGQSSYLFPPYYEEVFCGNSIGMQFGLTVPLGPGNISPAIWPFAEDANCKYAYTNYSPLASLFVPNFVASCGMAFYFGLQGPLRRPFVGVSVSQTIKIAVSGVACPLPFYEALPVGANYTRTFSGPNQINYAEISSDPEYSSGSASVFFQTAGFFGGQLFFSPWECPDGPVLQWQSTISMSSSTNYFIYLDDPVHGNQRTFPIWQPSPSIDPWGFLDGSTSGSISIGYTN